MTNMQRKKVIFGRLLLNYCYTVGPKKFSNINNITIMLDQASFFSDVFLYFIIINE